MTTFEHAMLGANAVFATGLHRRYGWHLAAIAAFSSIVPDWDGLTVLYDTQVFDRGHRVWGHNVFACLLTGLLVGSVDYRFDVCGRIACRTANWRNEAIDASKLLRLSQRTFNGWLIWVSVAVVSALSQIPADAVVSSGDGLSDWPLKPFWPLSDREFIYPMAKWGDPGITLVFCAGMIAMARWRHRVQTLALLTLGSVATYLVMCHCFNA